jgi:(2Fe-2S) ferredoxin
MAKLSPQDLERMAQKAAEEEKDFIRVGLSTCGIAAGAQEVWNVLVEEAKKRNLAIEIKKCGCLGMCYAEPMVEVKVSGLPAVVYGKVNKEVATKIIEKHVAARMLVNEYIFDLKAKE